ncbi:hypothetical protein HMPREF0682_2496 [Propionibacterium acidifaciens F0233]|uniref:Uncharacterized protein n=1 Tax=Propionibacterium acidifaciens F0233 TaxID=553198 RepID=U2RAB2_9ACTN|nr:hypothetical protein HMPREF0682_2496 [Propionibacterium acidifaciens F0233]
MEPGHEDREYWELVDEADYPARPQWSPVMKTGNTRDNNITIDRFTRPQWSPVMKTGNTSSTPTRRSSSMSCLNGARS